MASLPRWGQGAGLQKLSWENPSLPTLWNQDFWWSSFFWYRTNTINHCQTRNLFKVYTLLGTNISPEKSILKMIFLFPRWDMLISWRVYLYLFLWFGLALDSMMSMFDHNDLAVAGHWHGWMPQLGRIAVIDCRLFYSTKILCIASRA